MLEWISVHFKLRCTQLTWEWEEEFPEKMLRWCFLFFDLEKQTFPKIRIWSYRIDYILVMIKSSYYYFINLDALYT